jgi:hypothetical protein
MLSRNALSVASGSVYAPSLHTDQLSNVRGERHWETVIIIGLFPLALVAA